MISPAFMNWLPAPSYAVILICYQVCFCRLYICFVNITGAVSDQNSAEGEVLFNITAFDLAGNSFTADQTQLDSSNPDNEQSSNELYQQ